MSDPTPTHLLADKLAAAHAAREAERAQKQEAGPTAKAAMDDVLDTWERCRAEADDALRGKYPEAVREELREAARVMPSLPETEDGKKIVPEMDLHHVSGRTAKVVGVERYGGEWWIELGGVDYGTSGELAGYFSTPAAAEAARAKEGAKA